MLETAPAHTFATAASRQETLRRIDGTHFYHAFNLSNGVRIVGDYDVARSIASYPFPDLRGARVLDIGPASGWFSFYFEALGANVTVLETRGYCDFDVYGTYEYPSPGRKPDRIENGQPIWFGPVSQSYWIMHDLIGSRVQWVNGRAYDASPTLFPEPFDLVFMGYLLLHLRDPIGALRAARSVCSGMCIATTYDLLEQEGDPTPVQIMPWTHLDRISWWLPNRAALAHWMSAAGFRDVDVGRRLAIYPDRERRDQRGRIVNEAFPSRIAVGFA